MLLDVGHIVGKAMWLFQTLMILTFQMKQLVRICRIYKSHAGTMFGNLSANASWWIQQELMPEELTEVKL